ncbi:hypothetical protein GCM10023187_24050 [Nibrella viscosa]|uniref:Uncharacterized protein n=1 Tax=Nibrella viscosa TaxID=1084524 RepID=A0ABP8KF49_9BACT
MRFPINLPAQEGRFTDDELFAFCRANPDLHIERDENGQIFFKVPTGTQTSY